MIIMQHILPWRITKSIRAFWGQEENPAPTVVVTAVHVLWYGMIVIRIDLFFWHMHNSSFHPYCFYIEPIYVSLALFVYHTYGITYRKQSLIPFFNVNLVNTRKATLVKPQFLCTRGDLWTCKNTSYLYFSILHRI